MILDFSVSPRSVSLAILNDTLYWTDIQTPYLHYCNKFDGSDRGLVYAGFGVTGLRRAVSVIPSLGLTGTERRLVTDVHHQRLHL